MLRNVFLKSLRDQGNAILWWTVGICGYAAFMFLFWPTIRTSASQMNDYLRMLPEGFKAAFLGEVTDLSSPAGYLSGYLTTLIVPLLFVIYAIGFGADAIAGEEDRGTLDLLLANPVSRIGAYLQKLATMTAAIVGLAGLYLVTMVLGVLVVGMDIGFGPLLASTVSTVLFGLCMGALALAVGAATGSKGRASGVAYAVVLVSYLLNSFGPLVEWLKPYRKVSLFYLYTGIDPLLHGLTPIHVVIFVALTAIFVAGGAYLFSRRDLAV